MKKKHVSIDIKNRAIYAVKIGTLSVTKVALTLGLDRRTLHRWLEKKKANVSLKRKYNPLSGNQSKILGVNLKEIVKIVKKPATDYNFDTDFWTTTRLIRVLKKELNLKVSRMAIFRTFKRIHYSYKIPETRYYKANKKKQKEWVETTVPEIIKLAEKHNALKYFFDEANISLTPVAAKTWGPIGKRKIAKISGNRGSISAISAISSDGRLLFNVHDQNKRYKGSDIIHFLSQMLAHHRTRHLVVIMDQAPCHKAKPVKAFVAKQKRLHVFYLPARSPEFNPDEKVWFYLKNKKLKSHKETTTSGLAKLTKKHLNKIKNNKSLVEGIYKMSDGSFF